MGNQRAGEEGEGGGDNFCSPTMFAVDKTKCKTISDAIGYVFLHIANFQTAKL